MTYNLTQLGFTGPFAAQAAASDAIGAAPYRLTEIHRDRVTALGTACAATLIPDRPAGELAVGDWVLADPDTGRILDVLDRRTVLRRRAAGTGVEWQLIAANVDVLFIVTACGPDFSAARTERYLALAHEAGCYPVVVLTKADLAADAADYRRAAEALAPHLTVLTVDARTEAGALGAWLGHGQTGALVGSSGVGKTTLINGLTGMDARTGGVRVDDDKGRHTTTSRQLVPLAEGDGWLIDTPGMRALRLAGVTDGIAATYPEIEELAQACRFADCAHRDEPGCAVTEAVARGELDPDRLQRWRKLVREDARNSETLAESRARDKRMGKIYREAAQSRRDRRDPGR